MKVLVCGGRDYNNYDGVKAVLDSFYSGMTGLCHGAADGADSLARRWYNERVKDTEKVIRYSEYPAEWRTLGKSAGAIRNRVMFDNFKPDLVIAFHGGRGTDNMVNYARSQNCNVFLCGIPKIPEGESSS